MGIEKAIGGVVGGLLGGLGGSKKSGSATSTATNTPWAPVGPYILNAIERAQSASHTPFAGPSLGGDATRQMQSTIRGDYLNPASNPFLQGYVNDALGQVKSQFAGQFGGPAGQNLGNSGYQESLARGLAGAALPIYSNAYNQERQNQLQASLTAQDIDRANTMAPFAPLQAYADIIKLGTGFGSGTQSQPYFTNPAAGALGGALAGSQIGGLFSGDGDKGGSSILGSMIPKPIIFG
jgi:hypothetical protein